MKKAKVGAGSVMVYGTRPLSEKQKEERANNLFKYIDAKIRADKLNPEEDYDNLREMKFLEEIAVADLHPWLRRELVTLLIGKRCD